MRFSEEQIRKVVTLRDDLDAKIRKHQEEIEMLEGNIGILDVILKESSFTKASAMITGGNRDSAPEIHQDDDGMMENNTTEDGAAENATENSATENSAADEAEAPRPITDSDGQIMANVHVTPDQISIIINDGMQISDDTPPFRSFFLDRILNGMKTKDVGDADSGKIQKESMISHSIEKDGEYIKKIIIRNYRQDERVGEIMSTINWSLARMRENAKK